MQNMLVFLFGLAGVGKNYVGEVISKHLQYKFVDADIWLTQGMLQAIKNKQLFTQDMLDNFIDIIIDNTQKLMQENPQGLIIAQALYRQKNRIKIQNTFPQANMIQVSAEHDIIIKRLASRGDHVPPDYAQLISKYFEPPLNNIILDNNLSGKSHIIQQINQLLPYLQ